MAVGRYSFLGRVNEGTTIATSEVHSKIYKAVINGNLSHTSLTLKENMRLDTLAGQTYNDSSLWWVIAAASGIGWGLQVPPGVRLVIPLNPGPILNAVG